MTQIINTSDTDSLDGFSRGGQKADILGTNQQGVFCECFSQSYWTV